MNLMTPMLLNELKGIIKENNLIKFYSKYEWRRLRKGVRRRDNNECQRCKELGKYSKAQVVHHIKEVKEFPELALDIDNCQTLCNMCHNIIHPEKRFKNKKRKKYTNSERW